jgi:hypothetical protein
MNAYNCPFCLQIHTSRDGCSRLFDPDGPIKITDPTRVGVDEIPKAVHRMINEQPRCDRLISVTMHPDTLQAIEDHFKPFFTQASCSEPKIFDIPINVSVYLAERQVLFHLVDGSMQFLRVDV